jgi:O-antigen/teichoic acid export membrane protein
MSQTAYGEFNLALTGTMLIHMFSSGPLGQAATRYFAHANETRAIKPYAEALFQIGGLVTAIVLLASLAGSAVLAALHLNQRIPTVFWWLIYSVLYSAITVCDAVQSGARQRSISAIHQAASQWLRPLFALFTLTVAGSTCDSALAGFAAANILVFLSQVFFLRRTLYRDYTESPEALPGQVREYRELLYRYAWPFASYGILAWTQFASDRWLLDFFRGPQSVAVYSVSYQLGYQPMNLITAALSAFLSPILFQIAGGGGDPERVRRATRWNWAHVYGLLGVTVVAALVAGLMRHLLFRLLAAPSYAAYSGDLPIMVAAGGLFACGQALTMMFFLGADSGAIVGPKVAASVVGVVLNYIGSRYFGIRGAVVATFLFSAIYAGIVALQVLRWSAAQRLRWSAALGAS